VEGFRKIATPNCQRRFYQESVTYIQKEAEYRESGKVVNMGYYHDVRRGSSAALTCFALFEPVFGIDLPNEVVEHPVFKEISIISMYLFCWYNVSYIIRTTFGSLTQRTG
jgi:hypothetical protein